MDPRKRLVAIITEGIAHVAANDIINQAASSARAEVARNRRQAEVDEREARYKAEREARAAAAARLQAAHPDLVSPEHTKGGALVAAAKNIRTQLKARWPHVKFSVRTDRFSGGDSIDVKWTDGPTTAQVDAIIGRYKAGTFDGMTDSYEYKNDAWIDAFGDAKYVHSSREISPELRAWAEHHFGENRDGWNRDPAYTALQKLSIVRVKK